jgi:hypothetical protein
VDLICKIVFWCFWAERCVFAVFFRFADVGWRVFVPLQDDIERKRNRKKTVMKSRLRIPEKTDF